MIKNTIKNTWFRDQMKTELSHNVYNDDSQKFSAKCCNYLIFNGKLVTPCNNLTTAINIAKEEKCICTIFESISSKGRFWQYMCDISKGALYG